VTEGITGQAGQISKDIEFGKGTSCPVPVRGIDFFNNPPTALGSQVGGQHYQDMAVPPFVFLRQNNVPHAEGEIIYHVLRHRSKYGRKDLEKAMHWIQLIIESEYAEAKDSPCTPPPPPVSSSSDC